MAEHRIAVRLETAALTPGAGTPAQVFPLVMPAGPGWYVVDRLRVRNSVDGTGATTYQPRLYDRPGPADFLYHIVGADGAPVAQANPAIIDGGYHALANARDGSLYLSLHLDASDGSDSYLAVLTAHKVG